MEITSLIFLLRMYILVNCLEPNTDTYYIDSCMASVLFSVAAHLDGVKDEVLNCQIEQCDCNVFLRLVTNIFVKTELLKTKPRVFMDL